MGLANPDRELERVLAAHAAALSRVAASYESRPALREELLQDIVFAIWRALPSFRGESSERTFVLRIATNRALSHLAARWPEKVTQTFSAMEAEKVCVTFFQDPAPRPDELAARQQGAPPIADLARMARRERRLLMLWIGFDWLVAAAFLAFAVWLWFSIDTPVMGFSAIGIVVLTLVVLAFTIVNWRGMFAGDRGSAADFLALALKRSRARLRYVRFGWTVLVGDLAVIAGAFYLELRDEGMARLPGMLLSAAVATAAAAAILVWWGRRERRRAERLAAMQQALAADPEKNES